MSPSLNFQIFKMEVVIGIDGVIGEKSDNMHKAVKNLTPPLITFMVEFIPDTLTE